MAAVAVQATPQALAQTAPGSLAREARPEPSNLSQFIANKSAAIALGKALFWDMRVGSDGKTACASCHFHAGADPRSKNQLAPGAGSVSFAFGGPNYQLQASDFPFHQFSNVDDRNSSVIRSSTTIASSQGVFRETFSGVVPGQAEDARQVAYDPVFHIGSVNTRRVEPLNTPTNINAVFNLRNFWDGRAQTIFNGVNVWGKRDSNARVFKSLLSWNPLNLPNGAVATSVTLNDSSLASQAAGPPTGDFEMSAAGRTFPELGRKMNPMRPLAGQQVASDDSVLGSYRHATGDGLSTSSYKTLVQSAFKPEWWNANLSITLNGKSYSQSEANFSLFYALSIQLYQATLVSDQAPYDKFAEGMATALTSQQQQGLGLFVGKGKCANCHGGAAFTNAAIRRGGLLPTKRLTRMVMGNGGQALYDEGFYNIGVTPTANDIGVGGVDPWGKPLSFSRLSQINLGTSFYPLELEVPNVAVSFSERVAVLGAFKAPTLRNVTLTAPYFHNGGTATLMQVIEFYNRGGNFAQANIDNLDADIQPLGLSQSEKEALVAFLGSLTDDRVGNHRAPFDHPELRVPNGHVGNTASVTNDGFSRAVDQWLTVPQVGRNGYAASQIPKAFLAN